MAQVDYLAELQPLTPRQLEVLVYAAKGFNAEETAGLLCIAVHTVRQRRSEIRAKLGINLYAACALAARAGIA